jgi:glycosyltransferase involved in cell wall biosynthesis
MHNKILITTPKLSDIGGVSSFLNALFKAFQHQQELLFQPIQIGGNGKNILGPLLDQYRLYQACNQELTMGFVNPSLLSKSFFRDGLFCKQFVAKKIPFVVFFHGWDRRFEKKVTHKYVNFFLNSFGKAQTIFVLSEAFKNKIIEWGYKGEVIVETTIIDDDFTQNFSIEEREQTLQNQKNFKILFLARTEAEKGVFEMVDAFIKLLEKHKNIELLIAGDGKDFKELYEMTKDVREIRLLGYVEGEDKRELFKTCDLYVLPSHSEGLPISVLEAMAFALPILTTPVGGLREFFQDEQMGYLVKEQDSNDLRHKIELTLSNKRKCLEQGQFNGNYAKEHLYASMLARRLAPYLKVNK